MFANKKICKDVQKDKENTAQWAQFDHHEQVKTRAQLGRHLSQALEDSGTPFCIEKSRISGQDIQLGSMLRLPNA